MCILSKIENEIRRSNNYGVQFSIDADAYDCRIGDRVSFGDNETSLQGGSFHNYQDVVLDGKTIGYLEEIDDGKLFHPMIVSFYITLADCTEHELWDKMEKKHKGNPHLYDKGESLVLRFATLNQMLDYLSVS